MPPLSNQALPYSGTIFAEGKLTCTLPGGTPDGIELGIVQEVSFSNKITQVGLKGSGSKRNFAVGISEIVTEVTAKFAIFSTEAIIIALGGAAVYDSGSGLTTLSVGKNDAPVAIKMTLWTPADGSDAKFIFFKLLSSDLKVDFKTHEFAMSDWTAVAHPDPSTGNVFQLILPGNQTAS